MNTIFLPGDKVFFVENANRVKAAEIVRCSGGSCIIRFVDRNGGTRLNEKRLFRTAEEALETTRKNTGDIHGKI